MLISEINGALLAYLGDAVIERLVRKRLILSGGKLGEINKIADKLVRAGYQSGAADRILPDLTEEEASVFRRGKNIHTNSIPKSATASEYRKATGLEAVFGYLDLKGDTERIEALISKAFFNED
jgi:ribonuclease-3 family protein